MIRTLLVFLIFGPHVFGQNNMSFDKARKSLEPAIARFDYCLADTGVAKCSKGLISSANNDFEKYSVAKAITEISPKESRRLSKNVYSSQKNVSEFILLAANSLHREGKFSKAFPLYNKYQKLEPNDFRVHVWLSECYINTGETKKALEEWKLADHSKNQVGVNQAIHTVHLNSSQYTSREELRKKVKKGDQAAAFDLIYLDMNWEIDWWNHSPRKDFAKADLYLIKKIFGPKSKTYDQSFAYTSIKSYAKSFLNIDHVRSIFHSANLVIDNGDFVPSRSITADLISIALTLGLINEQKFYKERNKDLVDLINQTSNGELVNLYIYLEETVKGEPNNELNKRGWTEFNDEKCAVSYFMNTKGNFSENEINKAIKEFPNSAKLEWIRMNRSDNPETNRKQELIKLIKKEFKTLDSDDFRYSTSLNGYFRELSNNSKTSQ